MGRALRIDHPGAWHHVGHRGLDGRAIFNDEVDRRYFCTLLGDVLERFGLETHAWCLMGNHHHLLVRSAEGRLSRAMQYLNAVYTQRFNWRHERSGALLRGRFHSTRIDTDEYLAATSRYIHRNPVEAGIVASPEQYRWSSYRGYLNERDADPWLQRAEILGRHRGSRIAHHRYVTDSAVDPVAALLARADAPAILRAGLDGPRHDSDPSCDGEPHDEHPRPVVTDRDSDLSAIDDRVAAAFDVEVAMLRRGRKGTTNLARLAAIDLARRISGATQGAIADRYGFRSVRAAESAMRRAVLRRTGDADFADAMARIERSLTRVSPGR